jgi:hypothetical protein
MHTGRHPSPLPPNPRRTTAGSPLPPDPYPAGKGYGSPLPEDPGLADAAGHTHPERASRVGLLSRPRNRGRR